MVNIVFLHVLGEYGTIETGQLPFIKKKEAKTPFLKYGDTVKIEMRDAEGGPLFGAIEQTVAAPAKRGAAPTESDAPADPTEAATAE